MSNYLSINGIKVEDEIAGFHSFNVQGRNIPETEIKTNANGSKDGNGYQYTRYNGRTLSVSYAIVANSETELHRKFEQLNAILDAEQCKIVFGDDPDVYYIGTKDGMTEPTGAPCAKSGIITFYCCDPFKYSVAEHEINGLQTIDDVNAFVVDYNGTMPARPTIEFKVTSDNGYFGIYDADGNIIQVGDPDEVDAGTVSRSDLIFVDDWQNAGTLDGWTQHNAPPFISGMKDVGTMYKPAGNGWATVQSYGSGANVWHGVTMTRAVTAAVNGTFTWKHLIQTTHVSQVGSFQASIIGVVGGVEKHLAKIVLTDAWSGSNRMIFNIDVNGQQKRSVDIDSSKSTYNSATGVIRKSGETFTFTVRDSTYTFKCPELAEAEITKVGFCMAQYGTNTFIKTMRLYDAKFVRDYEGYEDIPNKFSAGDVVVIDCGSGKIMVNNNRADGLGALGNAWERFGLRQHGRNVIGVAWSSWAQPPAIAKLKYREVSI